MAPSARLDRSRGSAALAATFALVAALAAPSTARAQQADDPLALADRAYADVDYEAAGRHAQQALERGGNDRRRLARIYQILGLARAAAGNGEGAREAFVRLLVFDPESRIDRGLSPQMRAPLLEARGYWSDRGQRLAMDVRRVRDGGLEVTLTDPLGLARQVLLRARVGRGGAWTERVQPASPRVVLELPGDRAARVEYFVQALDEHRNRVLEQGSEEAPEVVEPTLAPGAGTVVAPGGDGAATGPRATTILGATGVTAGVLSLIGSVVAWRVREGHAARWNGDACLTANPATDRMGNCEPELRGAQTAESVSTATLVLGSVLLVGGVVLLALPAVRERAPRANATGLRCGPGPGLFGVGCEARF